VFAAGEQCQAQWRDGYYYPAIVGSVEGTMCTVNFNPPDTYPHNHTHTKNVHRYITRTKNAHNYACDQVLFPEYKQVAVVVLSQLRKRPS
jgi:hypothetical protein